MESMGLTRYMIVLMDDALKQARFFDHEFVMPEHMLLSLLRQFAFCQALQEEGVDSFKMHEEVVNWLAKQERIPNIENYTPEPSSLFKTMFGTACALAAAADRVQVNVTHFVQAMFGLQNSEVAFLLGKSVGDRQGEFLANVDSYYPLEGDAAEANVGDDYGDDNYDDYDDEEGRTRQPQDWHQLVTCISDKVEQHNPLIGREEELDRTIQVLCRAEKNNPLHIGEPGVGKTALVYGLAKIINENQIPNRLKGARIYSMDMTQMLAGAQYRGDFEKRIKMVMEGATKEGNTIIYLDEIHNIMGAGRASDGGLDASNMLKQYLEAGDIRFIGSTTYEEFNRYMAQSKGIVRRFQQIDIKEPTEEEAIKILEGLQYKYNKFHTVTYRKDALEYAVRASAKYISNRCLPDKAIDLIDEAGAYMEVHPANRQRSYVTKAIIQQILTKVCKIDAAAIKEENNDALATLQKRILDKIYGQDKAVDKVVEAVMMAKAGLVDDDKPMASLLFVGPTGVGKTEVARVLAKELGVELVRFDMSEYTEKHAVAKLIGSPAGYVGYEDGGLLTDAIRKTPNCVLLLDEIEKAHSDIYNILLQVMDYARLTDNKGQKADFRNVILIMTSNAGAQYASQASVGFTGNVSRGDAMLAQVKKTFKPEFINRLSDTVVFNDMDKKMAEMILEKKLGQLDDKLATKGVYVDMTDAAREQLLKWGFTKEYGAREMDRVIGNRLKPLLMKALLFGKLKKAGKAVVDFDGKELVLS